MTALNYSIYDCFAEKTFAGHAAAVVTLPQKIDHALSRKVAAELCQTITCFVWKEKDQIWVESFAKDGELWPINHGLLGVVKHFVDNKNILNSAEESFAVKVVKDKVTISVPKRNLALMETPERLNQAFDMIPVSVREIQKTCIIELRTAKEIFDLEVDFSRMSKLNYDQIVFTAEDNVSSFDYVYRYFSPKHYINENSGSLFVQTFLPLFWGERLRKDSLTFMQSSSRRAVGSVNIEENCIRIEASVKRTFDGVLKII